MNSPSTAFPQPAFTGENSGGRLGTVNRRDIAEVVHVYRLGDGLIRRMDVEQPEQ